VSVPLPLAAGGSSPGAAASQSADDADAETHDYGRWRSRLVLVALCVLAGLLVIVHVASSPKVSPVDELQHLDYAIKASHFDFVGAGDQFGGEAMRIEACHRLDAEFDAKVPPCPENAATLDPPTFQEGGFNTAYIHPPTYYLIDGLFGRALSAVAPGHDDLTLIRLGGVLWVVGAVVFLWLLLSEVGAGIGVRAALILAAISTPAVLSMFSTINPDGTALLVGAALTWTVLRAERRRLPWWVPALAAGAAIGLKATNATAIGVVVIYLVLRLYQQRRDNRGTLGAEGASSRKTLWKDASSRARLLEVGGIVSAAGVIAAGWIVVAHSLQVMAPSKIPMVARFRAATFPVAQMSQAWQAALNPLGTAYLAPFLRASSLVIVLAGLTALLLFAGTLAGAVLSPPHSRLRTLAVASLVVVLVAGPALVLFNYVAQGIYVDIPPRYALAAVPAMLACASVPMRRRAVLAPVGILAALTTLAIFVQAAVA